MIGGTRVALWRGLTAATFLTLSAATVAIVRSDPELALAGDWRPSSALSSPLEHSRSRLRSSSGARTRSSPYCSPLRGSPGWRPSGMCPARVRRSPPALFSMPPGHRCLRQRRYGASASGLPTSSSPASASLRADTERKQRDRPVIPARPRSTHRPPRRPARRHHRPRLCGPSAGDRLRRGGSRRRGHRRQQRAGRGAVAGRSIDDVPTIDSRPALDGRLSVVEPPPRTSRMPTSSSCASRLLLLARRTRTSGPSSRPPR